MIPLQAKVSILRLLFFNRLTESEGIRKSGIVLVSANKSNKVYINYIYLFIYKKAEETKRKREREIQSVTIVLHHNIETSRHIWLVLETRILFTATCLTYNPIQN